MREELSKAKNHLNDTIKIPNVRVVGVPETVEREVGLKHVFDEIINEKERGNSNKGRAANSR